MTQTYEREKIKGNIRLAGYHSLDFGAQHGCRRFEISPKLHESRKNLWEEQSRKWNDWLTNPSRDVPADDSVSISSKNMLVSVTLKNVEADWMQESGEMVTII